MIFVELPSERRWEPLFGDAQHLDDDEPARRRCPHFVADRDRMARFHAHTVDLHVTAGAGIASERPGLEEPRGRKPLIDSNGIHRIEPSAERSF